MLTNTVIFLKNAWLPPIVFLDFNNTFLHFLHNHKPGQKYLWISRHRPYVIHQLKNWQIYRRLYDWGYTPYRNPQVIQTSVNFSFLEIFSADITPEMLKICRVTKVKVFFPVLVYVFNFNVIEFSATILEKGLLKWTGRRQPVSCFRTTMELNWAPPKTTEGGKGAEGRRRKWT